MNYKYDLEILQVIFSDNEKYLGVLTEGTIFIYDTKIFIEAKEEKVMESFQIPIAASNKLNIYFDLKIVDTSIGSYLYLLNKSNKTLLISNLLPQPVVVKEFINICQFEIFNKNLVLISGDYTFSLFEIILNRNSIEFYAKSTFNIAKKLDFDLSKM